MNDPKRITQELSDVLLWLEKAGTEHPDLLAELGNLTDRAKQEQQKHEQTHSGRLGTQTMELFSVLIPQFLDEHPGIVIPDCMGVVPEIMAEIGRLHPPKRSSHSLPPEYRDLMEADYHGC